MKVILVFYRLCLRVLEIPVIQYVDLTGNFL